jgi:CheY-like chemotaxis protein
LTASAFEENRQAALLVGCDDFIRKPFQREAILETMAKQIGVQYRFEDVAQPSLNMTPNQGQEGLPCTLDVTALAMMPRQ